MTHRGSCLCGRIQYEVEGEFEAFFLCHCKSCRKDTGSAHAANLFSHEATLTWLKGADEVKSYDHNNSGHIKSFCPNCSSALPNLQQGGALVMVPAGSLDTDINIEPTGHIYLNEKAKWDTDLYKAPHYEELP
ncbi:GFA family protein [Spirochaeta cellobiosiphila]|uniref:GFA family protein n=1 Tax=Spirochaeta cellobiosiphila TaxID=504483 RepID=UPI000423E858|nr:GFA family protein [Spirochaeta cellobiosiphila]